jgi:hypothetical protein
MQPHRLRLTLAGWLHDIVHATLLLNEGGAAHCDLKLRNVSQTVVQEFSGRGAMRVGQVSLGQGILAAPWGWCNVGHDGACVRMPPCRCFLTAKWWAEFLSQEARRVALLDFASCKNHGNRHASFPRKWVHLACVPARWQLLLVWSLHTASQDPSAPPPAAS